MDASWAQYAACRQPGTDPELFFPVSESGPAARQIAAAKAVCARCPAAAECRDWALRAGEPVGIWGGTTPEERRALRRARQPRAQPAGHRRAAAPA
jgi:WhiB family redox-sensing transcriptional regulator